MKNKFDQDGRFLIIKYFLTPKFIDKQKNICVRIPHKVTVLHYFSIPVHVFKSTLCWLNTVYTARWATIAKPGGS